jgi:hypothetical protein
MSQAERAHARLARPAERATYPGRALRAQQTSYAEPASYANRATYAEPASYANRATYAEPAPEDYLEHQLAPGATETPERHLHLVRQARRRRGGRRLALWGALAVLGAVPAGLVALHVLIAENQFKIDHLQQRASQEQAEYERERLLVAEAEAPSRIVSIAVGKLHMQLPGSVTDLPAPAEGGADPPGGGGAAKGDPQAPQGEADWPAVKPLLNVQP